METKKRTQAADIAEIATKLDGKVNFSSIVYSQQMLSEKYRETGVNDIYFIGKKFGLWFYTSRAADVFSDYELKIIRDVLKPQKQQCYRNAHLLCQLFPERVRYCEGKTNAFIPIDHAFNRVGDKYVDITFEFALNDPDLLGYEYVVFGEYDLPEIERMTKKTGYYGDIYRLAYMERRTPDAMK